MKKYKTSEAIAMLEQNPKLRFKGYQYHNNVKTSIPVVMRVNLENGVVDGYNNEFRIDEEWELIQQPVDFMTAVKAYAEGKTIRCERGNITTTYAGYGDMKDKESRRAINPSEILEGCWYIEEGDTND